MGGHAARRDDRQEAIEKLNLEQRRAVVQRAKKKLRDKKAARKPAR